ncbi:Receptor-like protein kinase FERONIA [Morella rubra]|uniref:Receptor-like protein kinase FERONIA n=1 Tax=Morella rubra TaxID=262757 RepID=A0A6A1VI48_9ROSI|nr:Receptor-like protein kinase FERONIA [Morella rubra]
MPPSVKGKEKKLNLSVSLRANPANWKTAKNDAILNGIEIFKLSDFSGKLAGPNSDSLPGTQITTSPPSELFRKPPRGAIPKATVLGGVLSGVVVLSIIDFLIFSKGKSTRTKALSLPDQQNRTSTFHEELIVGRGGFGHVYKGFIDHGTMIVAIKRLNPESKQGAREFWREINLLSQLSYVHLVSLIGYCDDDNEMILVYDYMTDGTLRDQLYDTVNDSIP